MARPIRTDRISPRWISSYAWFLPQRRMIRLHDLRHTHATLALAAGVHPKIVQERLGHANIAITLDITAMPCRRSRRKRPAPWPPWCSASEQVRRA
jgi:integrase